MGIGGWMAWLHEDIEDLKLLRSMTSNEEELKVIDEMIAKKEAKIEENK